MSAGAAQWQQLPKEQRLQQVRFSFFPLPSLSPFSAVPALLALPLLFLTQRSRPAAQRALTQALTAHARPKQVDFKDTFLDAEHLRESFPRHDVTFLPPQPQPHLLAPPADAPPQPPFRITFPDPPAAADADGAKSGKGQDGDGNGAAAAAAAKPKLVVQSYTPPDPGPYPQNVPPVNKVRFTPVQVDAIMAGERLA